MLKACFSISGGLYDRNVGKGYHLDGLSCINSLCSAEDGSPKYSINFIMNFGHVIYLNHKEGGYGLADSSHCCMQSTE